jgi:hypothetical protein
MLALLSTQKKKEERHNVAVRVLLSLPQKKEHCDTIVMASWAKSISKNEKRGVGY